MTLPPHGRRWKQMVKTAAPSPLSLRGKGFPGRGGLLPSSPPSWDSGGLTSVLRQRPGTRAWARSRRPVHFSWAPGFHCSCLGRSQQRSAQRALPCLQRKKKKKKNHRHTMKSCRQNTRSPYVNSCRSTLPPPTPRPGHS